MSRDPLDGDDAPSSSLPSRALRAATPMFSATRTPVPPEKDNPSSRTSLGVNCRLMSSLVALRSSARPRRIWPANAPASICLIRPFSRLRVDPSTSDVMRLDRRSNAAEQVVSDQSRPWWDVLAAIRTCFAETA